MIQVQWQSSVLDVILVGGGLIDEKNITFSYMQTTSSMLLITYDDTGTLTRRGFPMLNFQCYENTFEHMQHFGILNQSSSSLHQYCVMVHTTHCTVHDTLYSPKCMSKADKQ